MLNFPFAHFKPWRSGRGGCIDRSQFAQILRRESRNSIPNRGKTAPNPLTCIGVRTAASERLGPVHEIGLP